MSQINKQADFYRAIAAKLNEGSETKYTQKEIRKVWEAVVEVITESAKFADETRTVIPGIGQLRVKPYPSYTAHNPRKPKETIVVPARQRPYLHFGKLFKENINK